MESKSAPAIFPINRFVGVRICWFFNKTYKTKRFPEIPSNTTGRIIIIFTISSDAGLHIHMVLMKGVFDRSIWK